jgi:transcriptional regulator with XRE-family HTH domain
MFEPDAAGQDRKGLAESLRALRRDSGLSGERLANRAHMSQSKISRIESGRVLPSITEVERILTALKVPTNQAAELLALAKIANTDFLSRRKMRRLGATYRQREIAALMDQSSHIRFVLPTALPGLLQTPEYVRSNVSDPMSRVSDDQKPVLLAAKLASREALQRPDKRFSFLLTEAAVRRRVASSADMAEQVEHLVSASSMATVDLEVIPLDAEAAKWPINIFIIYDERLVIVETEAGSMALRDPVDVREHLELFEYYRRNALAGEECREFLRVIAADFRNRARGSGGAPPL